MIRFKCIYCGQRILAPDNGAGKKGKCPKCAHLLTVPESTKGRPAISPDKEPTPDRPKPPIPWAKEPGGVDADDEWEVWTEFFKESFGFMVPAYDVMSLLLPAITWILLYMANSQMRDWIRNEIIKLSSVSEILFIVLLPLVLLLAVSLFMFLVVIPLQTALAAEIGGIIEFRKKVMMLLAILINVGSGILIGVYVLSGAIEPDWLIIFPIWNIINCVLLLLMMLFKMIDEECISDREVTPFGIIFGLSSVLIIFSLCNYVFKLHWAITFSICIVYTTSFDKALQSVFPSLAAQDQQ